MSFLITGATGFIGKVLIRNLLSQGQFVAILTRDVENAKNIFSNSLEKIVIYDQRKFLSGKLSIDTKKYNKLIHLAWADVKNYMDEQNIDENLEFQKSLIKKLVEAGIKDITASGTCLEYGMREGACKEDDDVTHPVPTSYAQGKYGVYQTLLDLQKKNPSIVIKWLRFFYIYGVEQRPRSLLRELLKALDNNEKEFNMSMGDQRRDFINVSTLAKNIITVAGQNKVTGVINVGNGNPISVLEFVESVLKIKGKSIKLNKGHYPYASYEPKEFWANVDKLKKIDGIILDKKIWL